MQDTLGAFVPGVTLHRAPRRAGPLSGLTFAAKDLFDVAGVVTGQIDDVHAHRERRVARVHDLEEPLVRQAGEGFAPGPLTGTHGGQLRRRAGGNRQGRRCNTSRSRPA